MFSWISFSIWFVYFHGIIGVILIIIIVIIYFAVFVADFLFSFIFWCYQYFCIEKYNWLSYSHPSFLFFISSYSPFVSSCFSNLWLSESSLFSAIIIRLVILIFIFHFYSFFIPVSIRIVIYLFLFSCMLSMNLSCHESVPTFAMRKKLCHADIS